MYFVNGDFQEMSWRLGHRIGLEILVGQETMKTRQMNKIPIHWHICFNFAVAANLQKIIDHPQTSRNLTFALVRRGAKASVGSCLHNSLNLPRWEGCGVESSMGGIEAIWSLQNEKLCAAPGSRCLLACRWLIVRVVLFQKSAAGYDIPPDMQSHVGFATLSITDWSLMIQSGILDFLGNVHRSFASVNARLSLA